MDSGKGGFQKKHRPAECFSAGGVFLRKFSLDKTNDIVYYLTSTQIHKNRRNYGIYISAAYLYAGNGLD